VNYLGDIRLGTTLDFKFTTRRFTTGAPFALSGGVISAYVDNGTTELTAGITLTADFDGRTGLNHVRVVASSGNGYASGTDVVLVITTGTVDSVSVVGEVVGGFSIEFRSALMPTTAARTLDVSATGEAGVDWANVGSPTTTLNLSGTTIKTATDVETDTANIQTRIPAALVGGRMDADIGAISTDTAAAANLETAFDGGSYNVGGGGIIAASVTGAVGSVTGSVGSVTGAVGSVTGNVGGNVTGSVGSVATDGITSASLATSAITEIQTGLATAAALATVDDFLDTEIADIKAKTDALPADPADASDIAASFATVNATLATLSGYVDTEVAAIKAKTDNLPTDPADASDIASAFGTVNATLSTIAGYIDTEVAAILADTDELQTKLIPLVELTSQGYAFTDDALSQAPTGGSAPTAAAIADAVWDEALAAHLTPGTAGAALTDASLGADMIEELTELTSDGLRFTEIALEQGPTSASASDPWTAPLPGSYSAGQAGYIVGTNLDAQIRTRATQTSVDTIDGIVDAILVDTAVIGAAGAGLSAIPWNAAWDAEVQSEVADALTAYDVPTEAQMNARTLPSADYATASALQVVDDFVDTEVAAIKAKTDALPADPADASDIAGSFAAVNATLATIAGYVDTEVAAIKAKTDNLPSDPADASDIASAFGTVNATLATLSGYVDTEVAAIKATTDKIELMLEETSNGWRFEAFALSEAGEAILRTPMAEEYAADGAPMTAEQALHMIWALAAERAVAGTTLTARRLDGSTTAMTFTLNSATTPTEQTRAT
jgi:hypothetical protein